MRRNYILDSLLLLFSIILMLTGWALWGNTRQRASAYVVRLAADDPYQPARIVHRCASLVFLAGLLLHLNWHWDWIRENTPRMFHENDV